jgi:hypothetical protein
MARLGLTGGAYQAHSVIASAQRSVNLFSEPIPENLTEPSKATDYPTPGLRLLGTIGTGPIRGIRQGTNGNVYVVSGSEVYSVNTTSWVGTSLGSITAGLTTPVSMCDNTLDMVIVDGTANGWMINLAANTMAPLVDSTGSFVGADKVDYLDTFLIFNKPGTPQFYWTGSLATTFDALDFANKSSFTDLLQTLIVTKREIWLIGQLTTEIWYDTGATDIAAGSSQFASVQSVFVDHGTCAKYSVAGYDNGAFWLTRDRQGRGFVVMGAGYQTKRVSTYAIEAELAGYARLDDAIGYCYQLAGHTFYVLTFPHADHTWVYDVTTGLWHEWLWIDSNGEEHRHRSNCYWPVDGSIPVVGDWQNGNLYALDTRIFTDAGQPIKRVRSFPHMLADGKRVFYRQFLADIDAGTSAAVAPATFAFLSASFTAADGTTIDAYTSEVGGGWTVVGGASHAVITGDEVVGIGGDALYTAAVTAPRADYSVRFSVIPPDYTTVPTATVMFVAGRADAAGIGYRARISADGTQYSLSVTIGATVHSTVAMGTITSGIYTAWLVLRGTTIAAQVQRSQDGLWLRGDATWQASSGTTAAQFTDTTYAAPGLVAIGGTWPVPPPVVPAHVDATHQTPLTPDPNFPSGYSTANFIQAFDFTRDWFYAFATSSVNGIAITDLSSMAVIRTATIDQMYAGTAFGSPAGTPYSQGIFDLAAGQGSDLYMLAGVDTFHRRFTRLDPVSMKVIGEWYVPNGVLGQRGVVNTTATHTIVAYQSLNSTESALIYDGTGMAPVGLGPTPLYGNNNNLLVIAGQKHTDGSCDFIVVNSDYNHPTGLIDIWRVHVSDALVITSTKTGTANVLATYPAPANLYIAQADYDATHNTIIMQVTNSSTPAGPPIAVMSVALSGTINWVQSFASDIGIPDSKGQSLLNGDTLMIGDGDDLKLLDTATGAITFTGSVVTVSGSFYRVYDGSREAYWTYAAGSFGFTRIDFHAAVIPPTLGMDDVVATTEAPLSSNLISLRWSSDRGHSFGNPVSQSMGEVGEYATSLQWQRCGYARDRVWEISWSVPCGAALQGCWVDVTPAQS